MSDRLFVMSGLNKWLAFYFSYKGKIKRLPFALAYLSIFCAYLLFVKMFLMPTLNPETMQLDFSFKNHLMLIICASSAFALSIKRLRDCNRSAWFCLLYFLPVFNFLLFLYLLFKKSAVSLTFEKSFPFKYNNVA